MIGMRLGWRADFFFYTDNPTEGLDHLNCPVDICRSLDGRGVLQKVVSQAVTWSSEKGKKRCQDPCNQSRGKLKKAVQQTGIDCLLLQSTKSTNEVDNWEQAEVYWMSTDAMYSHW